MLPLVAALLFVVVILAVTAYALIRPWTHIHYEHTDRKLWKPLD